MKRLKINSNKLFTILVIFLIALQPMIVSAQTISADESDANIIPPNDDKLARDMLVFLTEPEEGPITAGQSGTVAHGAEIDKMAIGSQATGAAMTEIEDLELTEDEIEFIKTYAQELKAQDYAEIVHWLRHKGYQFKQKQDGMLTDEQRNDFTSKQNLVEQALQIESYLNSGEVNLIIARLNSFFNDILTAESDRTQLDRARVNEAQLLIQELYGLGAKEAADNYKEYLDDIVNYGETNAILTQLNDLFSGLNEDLSNLDDNFISQAEALLEPLGEYNPEIAKDYRAYLQDMIKYSKTAPLYNRLSQKMNQMSSPNYKIGAFEKDKKELLDIVKELDAMDAISLQDKDYIKSFVDNFMVSYNTNQKYANSDYLVSQQEDTRRALEKQSLVDLFGFARDAEYYAPEESEKAVEELNDYQRGKATQEEVQASFDSLFGTLLDNTDKTKQQLAEETKRGQNLDINSESASARLIAKESFDQWTQSQKSTPDKTFVYYNSWKSDKVVGLTNNLASILDIQTEKEKAIAQRAFEQRFEKNADAKCSLLAAMSVAFNLLPAQNSKIYEDSGCEETPLKGASLTQSIVIIPEKLKIYGKADISTSILSGPQVLFYNPFGLVNVNELDIPDTDNDGLLDAFDPEPEKDNFEEALEPYYPEGELVPARVPEEEPTNVEPIDYGDEEEIPTPEPSEEEPEAEEEQPEKETPEQQAAREELEDYYEEFSQPLPVQEDPERKLEVRDVGLNERMGYFLDQMIEREGLEDLPVESNGIQNVSAERRQLAAEAYAAQEAEYMQNLMPEGSAEITEEQEVSFNYCPEFYKSLPQFQSAITEIPVVYIANYDGLITQLTGKAPEKKLNDAREDLQKVQDALDNCENENGETINDLQDQIEDLEGQIGEITEQRNDLQEQLVELSEAENSGEISFNKFQANAANLISGIESLGSSLNNLQQQQNSLTNELNNVCAAERAAASSAQQEADRLEEIIEKYKDLEDGESEDGTLYQPGLTRLKDENLKNYYPVNNECGGELVEFEPVTDTVPAPTQQGDHSTAPVTSPTPEASATSSEQNSGAAQSAQSKKCDTDTKPFCHPCQIERIDEYLQPKKGCAQLDAMIDQLQQQTHNMDDQSQSLVDLISNLRNSKDTEASFQDLCNEVSTADETIETNNGESIRYSGLASACRQTGPQAANTFRNLGLVDEDADYDSAMAEFNEICSQVNEFVSTYGNMITACQSYAGMSDQERIHFLEGFLDDLTRQVNELTSQRDEVQGQIDELQKQKQDGCDEDGEQTDTQEEGPIDAYIGFMKTLASSISLMNKLGMNQKDLQEVSKVYQQLQQVWAMTQQQQAQIASYTNYQQALQERANQINAALEGDTSVYDEEEVNAHKGAFRDALNNINEQLEQMQENAGQMEAQLFETTRNALTSEEGPLSSLEDGNSFMGKLFKGVYTQKIEEYMEDLKLSSLKLKVLSEDLKKEQLIMDALSGPQHGLKQFGSDAYFIKATGSVAVKIISQREKNTQFLEKIQYLLEDTEELTKESPGSDVLFEADGDSSASASESLYEAIANANDLFQSIANGNSDSGGEEQLIIEMIKAYDAAVSALFNEAKKLVESEYKLAQGTAYLSEWWMGYGMQHANNMHQAIFTDIKKPCKDPEMNIECPEGTGNSVRTSMCWQGIEKELPDRTQTIKDIGLTNFLNAIASIISGQGIPAGGDFGAFTPLLNAMQQAMEGGLTNEQELGEILDSLDEIYESMNEACGGAGGNNLPYCSYARYKLKEFMLLILARYEQEKLRKGFEMAEKNFNSALKELGKQFGLDIDDYESYKAALNNINQKINTITSNIEEAKKNIQNLINLEGKESTIDYYCKNHKNFDSCKKLKEQQEAKDKAKGELEELTHSYDKIYRTFLEDRQSTLLNFLYDIKAIYGDFALDNENGYFSELIDLQILNTGIQVEQLSIQINELKAKESVNELNSLISQRDRLLQQQTENTAKIEELNKKIEPLMNKFISMFSTIKDEDLKTFFKESEEYPNDPYKLTLVNNFAEYLKGDKSKEFLRNILSGCSKEDVDCIKRQAKSFFNDWSSYRSDISVDEEKLIDLISNMAENLLKDADLSMFELAKEIDIIKNQMPELSKQLGIIQTQLEDPYKILLDEVLKTREDTEFFLRMYGIKIEEDSELILPIENILNARNDILKSGNSKSIIEFLDNIDELPYLSQNLKQDMIKELSKSRYEDAINELDAEGYKINYLMGNNAVSVKLGTAIQLNNFMTSTKQLTEDNLNKLFTSFSDDLKSVQQELDDLKIQLSSETDAQEKNTIEMRITELTDEIDSFNNVGKDLRNRLVYMFSQGLLSQNSDVFAVYNSDELIKNLLENPDAQRSVQNILNEINNYFKQAGLDDLVITGDWQGETFKQNFADFIAYNRENIDLVKELKIRQGMLNRGELTSNADVLDLLNLEHSLLLKGINVRLSEDNIMKIGELLENSLNSGDHINALIVQSIAKEMNLEYPGNKFAGLIGLASKKGLEFLGLSENQIIKNTEQAQASLLNYRIQITALTEEMNLIGADENKIKDLKIELEELRELAKIGFKDTPSGQADLKELNEKISQKEFIIKMAEMSNELKQWEEEYDNLPEDLKELALDNINTRRELINDELKRSEYYQDMTKELKLLQGIYANEYSENIPFIVYAATDGDFIKNLENSWKGNEDISDIEIARIKQSAGEAIAMGLKFLEQNGYEVLVNNLKGLKETEAANLVADAISQINLKAGEYTDKLPSEAQELIDKANLLKTAYQFDVASDSMLANNINVLKNSILDIYDEAKLTLDSEKFSEYGYDNLKQIAMIDSIYLIDGKEGVFQYLQSSGIQISSMLNTISSFNEVASVGAGWRNTLKALSLDKHSYYSNLDSLKDMSQEDLAFYKQNLNAINNALGILSDATGDAEFLELGNVILNIQNTLEVFDSEINKAAGRSWLGIGYMDEDRDTIAQQVQNIQLQFNALNDYLSGGRDIESLSYSVGLTSNAVSGNKLRDVEITGIGFLDNTLDHYLSVEGWTEVMVMVASGGVAGAFAKGAQGVLKIAGLMQKVGEGTSATYKFVEGTSLLTRSVAKMGIFTAESYGFVAGMNTIGGAVHGDFDKVLTGALPEFMGGDISNKDVMHSMLMLGGMKVAGKVFGKFSQTMKNNFQITEMKPSFKPEWNQLSFTKKLELSLGKKAVGTSQFVSSTAFEGLGMHTGQWTASLMGDQPYDFFNPENFIRSMIDAAAFKLGHSIVGRRSGRMSSAMSKLGSKVGEFVTRTEAGKKLATSVRINELNTNMKILESARKKYTPESVDYIRIQNEINIRKAESKLLGEGYRGMEIPKVFDNVLRTAQNYGREVDSEQFRQMMLEEVARITIEPMGEYAKRAKEIMPEIEKIDFRDITQTTEALAKLENAGFKQSEANIIVENLKARQELLQTYNMDVDMIVKELSVGERIEVEIEKPAVVELEMKVEERPLTDEQIRITKEFAEKSIFEIERAEIDYKKSLNEYKSLLELKTNKEIEADRLLTQGKEAEAKELLGDKLFELKKEALQKQIEAESFMKTELTDKLKTQQLTEMQKNEIIQELSKGEIADYLYNNKEKINDLITAATNKNKLQNLDNFVKRELDKLSKDGQTLEQSDLERLLDVSIDTNTNSIEWISSDISRNPIKSEIKTIESAPELLKNIEGATNYAELVGDYYAIEANGKWNVYELKAESAVLAERGAPALINKVSLTKAYDNKVYLPEEVISFVNDMVRELITRSGGKLIPDSKQVLWSLEAVSRNNVLIQAVMGEGKTVVAIPTEVLKLLFQGKNPVILTPEMSKSQEAIKDIKDNYGLEDGLLLTSEKVNELKTAKDAEKLFEELKNAEFIATDPNALQSLMMKSINGRTQTFLEQLNKIESLLIKDNLIIDEIQKIAGSTGLQLTIESGKVSISKIKGIDGTTIAKEIIDVIDWLHEKQGFEEKIDFAENTKALSKILMTNKEFADFYNNKIIEGEGKLSPEQIKKYEDAKRAIENRPEEFSKQYQEEFLKDYAEKFLQGTDITAKDLSEVEFSKLKERCKTSEQKAALEILARIKDTITMNNNVNYGIEGTKVRPYLKADNRIGPESMSFGDPIIEMLLHKMTGKATTLKDLGSITVSIKSMHLSPMDILLSASKAAKKVFTATPAVSAALLKLNSIDVIKSQTAISKYFELNKADFRKLLEKIDIPEQIQKEVFDLDMFEYNPKEVDLKIETMPKETVIDSLSEIKFNNKNTNHQVLTFDAQSYPKEIEAFKNNLKDKRANSDYVVLSDPVTGEWSMYKYNGERYIRLESGEIINEFGNNIMIEGKLDPRNCLETAPGKTLILNNKIEGIDFKAPEIGAESVAYRVIISPEATLTETLQALGRGRGYTVEGAGQYLDIIFKGDLKLDGRSSTEALLEHLMKNEFSNYQQTTYNTLDNAAKSLINIKLNEAKETVLKQQENGEISVVKANELLGKLTDSLIEIQQLMREGDAKIIEELSASGKDKLSSEIDSLERITDMILRNNFNAQEMRSIGIDKLLKGEESLEMKTTAEGTDLSMKDVMESSNVWDSYRDLISKKFSEAELPTIMEGKQIESIRDLKTMEIEEMKAEAELEKPALVEEVVTEKLEYRDEEGVRTELETVKIQNRLAMLDTRTNEQISANEVTPRTFERIINTYTDNNVRIPLLTERYNTQPIAQYEGQYYEITQLDDNSFLLNNREQTISLPQNEINNVKLITTLEDMRIAIDEIEINMPELTETAERLQKQFLWDSLEQRKDIIETITSKPQITEQDLVVVKQGINNMKTELIEDGLIVNEQVQDFTAENAELLIPYFTSVLDYLEIEAQDNTELETFYTKLKETEQEIENLRRNDDYTLDKEQKLSETVLDVIREEYIKDQRDVTKMRTALTVLKTVTDNDLFIEEAEMMIDNIAQEINIEEPSQIQEIVIQEETPIMINSLRTETEYERNAVTRKTREAEEKLMKMPEFCS